VKERKRNQKGTNSIGHTSPRDSVKAGVDANREGVKGTRTRDKRHNEVSGNHKRGLNETGQGVGG